MTVSLNDLLIEMRRVSESLQDSQDLLISDEIRTAMFDKRDPVVINLTQQMIKQDGVVNEFRRLVFRYLAENQK
jgi:hypothetical protein